MIASISKEECKAAIFGLQPRYKAAMVVVNTIKLFSKNLQENGF